MELCVLGTPGGVGGSLSYGHGGGVKGSMWGEAAEPFIQGCHPSRTMFGFARISITAYDPSVYGSMEGKVSGLRR